jgi:hypothetical protein
LEARKTCSYCLVVVRKPEVRMRGKTDRWGQQREREKEEK